MEGVIKQVTGDNESAFVYEADGNKLGEMVYTMSEPHKMVILHTEVDEVLKGQNIGKKLQASLVDYARQNNIKVVPVCPFAKAMFRTMKAWQDVLV